jgi:hypothetical protein
LAHLVDVLAMAAPPALIALRKRDNIKAIKDEKSKTKQKPSQISVHQEQKQTLRD